MADSQVSRAVASAAYFLSGCMAINASQFLSTPIYLVNKEWYNAWIAFTKQSFGLLTMTVTQCWAPTVVRVSGDKSVRGQLLETVDGTVLCNFPEKLVLMANHQIYTDWLYLWWIAYTAGMHGRIYIVLKESLRRIPVIGWGMQLSQFIFLKRNWEKDKPHLAQHLQTLNKPGDPMWLMMFPEGTNLAPSTRESSKRWAAQNGIKDMKHQLLPRSTGLQFCLQQLRGTVDYVYDCTIAYEGVPHGEYAQDVFTLQASYFQGHPPKSVNMYWRRFAVSSIPVDDSIAFELWLRTRWTEKDKLLEGYHHTGLFPADDGIDKDRNGKTRRGAGYIETEVKAFHWYDFLQVFAPLGLFGLVLYAFYGALPKTIMKSIGEKGVVKTIEDVPAYGAVKKLLKDTKEMAPPDGRPEPALNTITQAPVTQKQVTWEAAPKATAAKQAPASGAPTLRTQISVGKKEQQQQIIAAIRRLRHEQEEDTLLKRVDAKRVANLVPKTLDVKHIPHSPHNNSELNKPGTGQQGRWASERLQVRPDTGKASYKAGLTGKAPKKLDPKNGPKKLELKNSQPKKLGPKASAPTDQNLKPQALPTPKNAVAKNSNAKQEAHSTQQKIMQPSKTTTTASRAPPKLQIRENAKLPAKKLEKK